MSTMHERDKLPTVREWAEKNRVPEWRVREAIARGDLKADQRKRPMRIIEGRIITDVERHMRQLGADGQMNWLEMAQ